MNVAIYARVSTMNGQDPEMQLRELREYCHRRGWTAVAEYVDAGISGAKEKRPELDKLLADAHRRLFDSVVVWKFDRFARSVSHLLRALEEFRSLGIEFVSLSEQVDTSTPTGKMVFTVLGGCSGTRAEFDCGACSGGPTERESKGKATWATSEDRRRSSNHPSPSGGSFLAGDFVCPRRFNCDCLQRRH